MKKRTTKYIRLLDKQEKSILHSYTSHPFLTSYHHHLLWCPTQVHWVNKGSTCRPSTPSSHGSLPPPYLVQPLCTPSPLVSAWTTSTPWSPGLQHPFTWPRLLNFPLKVPSPTPLHPPLCTPPPLVFTWAMSTPCWWNTQHPLMPHVVPRGALGLPRPYAIPLPLSMPCVVPCGAPGYLQLSRSLPPPIGSAMVHPRPLLLARLWHLKCANPITGLAWWPGASALGFGHLPRCPDLAVWTLACTYHALVV